MCRPSFQLSWWCGRVTWWVNFLPFTPSPALVIRGTQAMMRVTKQDLQSYCVRTLWLLQPLTACPLLSEPWPPNAPKNITLWVTWSPLGTPCCRGDEGSLCVERWLSVHSTMRNEAETRKGLSKPRSQPPGPPSHILKHFCYQEGSACKFQNLSAGFLCKECWSHGMKGNPERQGNGCGRLLMGPSSPWAVSPVSLKHTFGVQVQWGGGVFWFFILGGKKNRKNPNRSPFGAFVLKKKSIF